MLQACPRVRRPRFSCNRRSTRRWGLTRFEPEPTPKHPFPAAQRIGAQLRGPAAAEYRPRHTLRCQAARRHDAAPLGCDRCSILLGSSSAANARPSILPLGGRRRGNPKTTC